MRQSRIRIASLGALATVLVVLGAGVAFAANGPTKVPARPGFPGFPGGGVLGGGPGGPGFAFGGPGFGVAGPGMRVLKPGLAFAGGAATLYADVLTPAAAFLNVSVASLASDLAGGKTLAQEATAKGKTAQDLITALVNAQKTVFDNEKAAGWITADQETALVTSYTDAVTELVNNGPGVPPGGPAVAADGGPFQLAASYLGISVSDLLKDLQGGKDLADVVNSVSGKTVAGLVAAIEAPAKAKLDAAVTAGTITQAQETAILANMTTRLTNFANTKPGSDAAASTAAFRLGLLRFAVGR
jgi:hypothetical protein